MRHLIKYELDYWIRKMIFIWIALVCLLLIMDISNEGSGVGKSSDIGNFQLEGRVLFLQSGVLQNKGLVRNGNEEAQVIYSHSIYIIKKAWHTGIVINIDSVAKSEIEPLSEFTGYKYVDIGWGDEKFYQSYGFDALLAAKALFTPTSSVIRFEGYYDLRKIYEGSDFFVRLELTEVQYLKLCKYISSGFLYRVNEQASGSEINLLLNEEKVNSGFHCEDLQEKDRLAIWNEALAEKRGGKFAIATSRRLGGKIVYYKSCLKYHFFNTCNTWVARGLSYSGLNVSVNFVVTAERLFEEIRELGKVYK